MSDAPDDVLDLSTIRKHGDPDKGRAQRRTLGGQLDLFELAELAEMTVADIYTLLSRRFHRDPQLRALFALAASEEHSHARRVNAAAARWRQANAGLRAPFDTQRVRHLMAEAQSRYDELEHSEDLGEELAMKTAVALEGEFEAAYAKELELTADPLLKQLFVELAHHGSGHEALLTRARQALYGR